MCRAWGSDLKVFNAERRLHCRFSLCVRLSERDSGNERVGPACPTHAASSPTEPLAARPAAEMIGGVSSSMRGYGPKKATMFSV